MEDREENLYYYVLSQVRALDLPPETAACAEFLVESLNQNGWLDEPLSALAEESGVRLELEEVIQIVASLISGQTGESITVGGSQ